MNDEIFASRFWAKVQKTKDGCWLWMGAIGTSGYGRFYLNGKNQTASRVAYQIVHGNIPHGMCVCHTCDNRQCVRPDHLWLGTHQDNIADMVTKGRHGSTTPHGEDSPKSKLTAHQVKEIRKRTKMYSDSPRQLATEYGVSVKNIHHILRGETWRALL